MQTLRPSLPLPLLLASLATILTTALPAQTALKVGGLSGAAPLTVTASATPTLLTVEMALQPEWHVYSKDVGGGQPVQLRVGKDCAFAAAGERKMPAGKGGKVHGDVKVTLPLQAKGEGGELVAVLDFMVCDPLMCLPPMSVTLTGTVGAAPDAPAGFPVLLVVDEKDERSARVEAFLQERGFEVGVTTYAEARPDWIERYEVVLADSKRFGETAKGARNQVLKFPKTKTPVVAVGFFGTELIEAQGVAMTSGYI